MFFIYAVLIILLILSVLAVLILNSKIEIQISNLKFSTLKKPKTNSNYEIYLRFVIFNKVKIFNINIRKIKIQKQNLNKNLNTAIKKMQEKDKNFDNKKLIKDMFKILKDIKIEVKKLDLKLQFGLEDAAQTAILVGVISSIITILLKEQMKNPNQYKITPIYANENILKFDIDCIIRIDLIHAIYKNILKGRDKNERKPSNRESYAYSNEQYT